MTEYFKKLEELLRIEKTEDESQYTDFIENRSIIERRAEGVSWYPVAIRNTEVQRADYLSIELERTTHQDISHAFRVGSPVYFFSNHNPRKDRIQGTVSYQSSSRIRILIRQDELPEWSSDGKLGLDLAFDNVSYNEMFRALKAASHHPSAEVLTEGKQAHFDHSFVPVKIAELNDSQEAAVNKILAARELAIVHGPPGTGKTTTLIQAIVALLNSGVKRILVAAPSNTAVDLLAEKLSENKVSVLRMGNPARISERLNTLTLEYKIAGHPAFKEIKKLKMQANEYRSMAHKYKRNFGRSEREQRKALFDEAYKILREVEDTEKYIIDQVFDQTSVVVATLVGSSNYQLEGRKFDVTVIDEAGQALEPACWIPLLKSEKLVLAGDHCQLPPTIKSSEAAKQGLEITLLEKLVATQPEAVVMLDTQYRMNEKIAGFSSEIFYKGMLKAHASVKDQVLKKGASPFMFIDTAGCGFEEKLEGTSVSNVEEAAFVIKMAEHFMTGLEGLDVGIISPYKQQLKFLEEFSLAAEALKKYKVTVNTIDSFQGQERDVILISMTRSNSENIIGFLSDIRRMNVAMTRARKLLIIVGDSATIGGFDFYNRLLTYAESNNSYQSAWEFMDS